MSMPSPLPNPMTFPKLLAVMLVTVPIHAIAHRFSFHVVSILALCYLYDCIKSYSTAGTIQAQAFKLARKKFEESRGRKMTGQELAYMWREIKRQCRERDL